MSEKNERILLDNKIVTTKLKWLKDTKNQWNVIFTIDPKSEDTKKTEYSITFDEWLNRVHSNGAIRICGKGFPHNKFNKEIEQLWFTSDDMKNGKILWLDSPNGHQRIPVLRNAKESANDFYRRVIVNNTNLIGNATLKDALNKLQNLDITDIESIPSKIKHLYDKLEDSKPELRKAAFWEPQIEGVFNEIMTTAGELDNLIKPLLNNISKLKESSREMTHVAKVYSNFSAEVGEDIHLIKFFDKGELKNISLSINSPNYLFGGLVFGFGAILFVVGGIVTFFIPPLGIVLAGFGVVFMGIGTLISILTDKKGASKTLENLKTCRDNLKKTTKALNQYSSQIESTQRQQDIWFSKMNDIANELSANKAIKRTGDELINEFELTLGNYKQGIDARNRLYNEMTQIDNNGKLVEKLNLKKLKETAEKVVSNVYSNSGGASTFDDEEMEDANDRNTEIVKSLEVRFLIEALAYNIWDVNSVETKLNMLTDGMSKKDLDALIIRMVFLHASNPNQVFDLLNKDKDLIKEIKNQMQKQGIIPDVA